MPYIALYRKYRPQTFTEVSAQPHITKTLAAQVDSESASHAYLFTGTRGTGKTTCAKILAKAVNCTAPVNGNPCGTCDICRDIEDGKITDVIEMDAASNSGVDNIRDLRDNAVYLPSRCKKRVFIIDECHMLSGGAWNALLKIIEEPPAHVMFIFATTEPNKVPATIASRCQRFDFHQIGESDIAARLQTVAKAEGITVAEDAASLIGRIADGALRDALSLLDTCVAASNGEEITIDLVANTAGLANRDYLPQFAAYIIEDNAADAIALCDNLYRNSKSLDILAAELAEYFRNLMITKTTGGKGNLVICTPAEQAKLIEQAAMLDIHKIIEILKLLSEALTRISKAQNKRLEFEIFLIKAIYGNGASAAPAQQPQAAVPHTPKPVPRQSNSVPQQPTPQTAPPAPTPQQAPTTTLSYLADTTISETADTVTIIAKTKFKADFIQNKMAEVTQHYGKRITVTVERVEPAEPTEKPDLLSDFLNAAEGGISAASEAGTE
jgi:DNA polymerase III, subunit gamma and tau